MKPVRLAVVGLAKTQAVELGPHNILVNVLCPGPIATDRLVDLTRQALPYLKETRGCVVNLSSVAGIRAFPGIAPYAVSKAAVDQLTHCLALELGPLGVRVNAVNPGFVRTPMQEREVAWEARLRGITPEEVLRDYLRQTPLGRLQTPEDVAKAVSFLAGPDSDFLTGEALEVNGGAWIF